MYLWLNVCFFLLIKLHIDSSAVNLCKKCNISLCTRWQEKYLLIIINEIVVYNSLVFSFCVLQFSIRWICVCWVNTMNLAFKLFEPNSYQLKHAPQSNLTNEDPTFMPLSSDAHWKCLIHINLGKHPWSMFYMVCDL